MFVINDIQTLSFQIEHDKTAPKTWHDRLKTIERGKFLSGNVAAEFQTSKNDTTILALTGKKFGLFITHNQIQMIITPTHNLSSRGRDGSSIRQHEPLSLDVLQDISTDFNMVVGTVLGTLGVDVDSTMFEIAIELEKYKVVYQDNRVEKIINPKIQSVVGESIKVKSSSAKFTADETFLEKPARTAYNLYRTPPFGRHAHNKVVFSGQMQFNNTGPQDLKDITVKYMARINQIADKMVGGLRSNG